MPSSTHKLQGLILDQELCFSQHAAHMIAEGTKWIMQIQRLAKPIQGLSFHNTRQLYNSIAIPKLLYAAAI